MTATSTRLVLGSASPARLATLRRAGVEPLVRVSGVDEDAVLARHPVTEPEEVALLLARAKAEDVAAHLEAEIAGTAIVVGCDSVLDMAGTAHGKPADLDTARRRWRRMRGGCGTLLTGHWLIDTRPDGSGGALGAVASTIVHFADVDDDDLEAYLATGEPLAVAGAFTVDGLGGPFVRGIEGDHHNVVGISLPLLREMLAALGVPWRTLWASPAVQS